MMDVRDDAGLWQAVLLLIENLEALGVEFYVGGSVASSYLGVARATQDVDLAIGGLTAAQTMMLTHSLEGPYYVDLETVRRAARTSSSFNLIHYDTMTKIDVFVQGGTAFDRSVMRRRVAIRVDAIDRDVDFASPEDIVLRKLLWWQMGNRASDRQWYDLVGVLKVRADRTDVPYLLEWAEELGIREHLESALEEAGLLDGETN